MGDREVLELAALRSKMIAHNNNKHISAYCSTLRSIERMFQIIFTRKYLIKFSFNVRDRGKKRGLQVRCVIAPLEECQTSLLVFYDSPVF